MSVTTLASVGRSAPQATPSPVKVIARVGAAFALSNVVRGAIRLVTSFVIARGLGAEAFGRWIFCAAWAATLTSALDLGFGVLLTRDAARDRRAGALLIQALIARIGLVAPVGLAFYVAAPRLGAAIGVVSELRVAVPLAVAGIAYGCFAAVFRGWTDRLIWILGMETAGAFLQGVLSWWLMWRGMGVVQLLWLATLIQLLQLVGAALLLARFRETADRVERPSVVAMVRTLRRSLPFALVGFIANAQQRVAPLLLGYLSSSAQVALFGAAWRLGSTAWALPSAAFAGALPVLAERAGSDDERTDTVKPSFHRALRAFGLAAAAGLALFAPVVVRLTYGAEFLAAVPALVCVAVGLVPSLLNAGRRVYLYAAQREAIALRWATVAFVVQVAACAILIPRWGAFGAAAGLLLGECAVWWPLRRA